MPKRSANVTEGSDAGDPAGGVPEPSASWPPGDADPSSRIEDAKEVGVAEAKQVEIEFVVAQRRELRPQHRLVPAGVLGDPVVGNDKRPSLRLAQMIEHDHRHLSEAQALRREHAAMAGDDHVIGADQHRIDEAEFGDRGGDLRNLILRMRSRVADIGNQPLDRPGLDLQAMPPSFDAAMRTRAPEGAHPRCATGFAFCR